MKRHITKCLSVCVSCLCVCDWLLPFSWENFRLLFAFMQFHFKWCWSVTPLNANIKRNGNPMDKKKIKKKQYGSFIPFFKKITERFQRFCSNTKTSRKCCFSVWNKRNEKWNMKIDRAMRMFFRWLGEKSQKNPSASTTQFVHCTAKSCQVKPSKLYEMKWNDLKRNVYCAFPWFYLFQCRSLRNLRI